jgi:hypothetical protein
VAILIVQPEFLTRSRSLLMATVITDPFEPVDPTSCPTCRSGLQPTEPPYDDAVDGEY